MRGFEWVPDIDHTNLSLPCRQTKSSAGYDLLTIEDAVISPGKVMLIPTGVRVRLLPTECLLIYARSSLAVKYQLILANGVGVIDADYYDNDNNFGHIFVPLFNIGEDAVHLERGERIAQGIFTPFLLATDDVNGSYDQKTRTGGFGSTDRV